MRTSSPPSSLTLPLHQAARKLPVLFLPLLLALQKYGASAARPTTYNVTPSGDARTLVPATGSRAAGTAATTAAAAAAAATTDIYSLKEALEMATAGDTILLGDGEYHDRLVSSRDGEEGSPITIVGGANAIIKATKDSIEINHSWISIQGFSVDGTIYADEDGGLDSFVDKCVRVDGRRGHSESNPLLGFVMKGMAIHNCGGECVRLKNYVQHAEITGNSLEFCGRNNFPLLNKGGRQNKNGEGIYIGTSSEQTGLEADMDQCNDNLISGNTIATHGNECVEVKEGSSGNMIEYNVCSDQLDVNSGCFCARGDSNTFRYNDVFDCLGAGVRLGGHKFRDYQFGQGNKVCGNSFNGVTVGSISVQINEPQGVICSNSCRDGSCYVTGNDGLTDIEATWDVECKLRDPCSPR